MEPMTLSVIVAKLVAKAFDRAEDEAIDGARGALDRLVRTVQAKLSSGNAEGKAALTALEIVPGGPKEIEGLAEALQRQATRDEAFQRELEELIGEAQAAGVQVESVAQGAIGDSNVQITGVSASNISINTDA